MADQFTLSVLFTEAQVYFNFTTLMKKSERL